MTQTGFSGTTYEVLTGDGKRWAVDSIHRIRTRAMAQAETLLGSKNVEAVRVTAKKDGWSRENVIFEQKADGTGKKLKVTPIDEAPPCRDLANYYWYPARRTMGRLIRQYLDEHGITALELLFDYGRLKMLELDDTFLSSAMQRVAGIQAKAAGSNLTERVEELYQAFERIKERARDPGEFDEYGQALKERGVDGLITEVKETVSAENRVAFILGTLATYLFEGRDWDDKLNLLIELAEQRPEPEALAYVDEIIAEILDGGDALGTVIGSQRDAVSAYRSMVHLALGRVNVPSYAVSSLRPLNDLLGNADLRRTRATLLERVQRGLSGLQPLTKEGRDTDREAFLTLLRDLTDHAGLLGGPGVCGAAVLRGKSVLGNDDEDLSLDQVIEQILYLFPNRAVRLGFLLDLSQSEVGAKHQVTVLGALMRLVQQLTSVASLVPAGTSREVLVATVDALRDRLGMGGLPEELRKAFDASLSRLLAEGTDDNRPKPDWQEFKTQNGTKKMASDPIERKKVEPNQIIFEEGDSGNEAYLVVDGQVEIFRKAGNRETVLATLGRGEVIGEMSLIDNQPRMASARTTADTELAIVSQDGLKGRLDRLEDADRVLRRLIDVFVQRLRGQARTAE